MQFLFKEVGTSLENRQIKLTDGIGVANWLTPNTTYEASIKETTPQNKYIVYKPNPTSINDRLQNFNAPPTDGLVNLTWEKYPSYHDIRRWEDYKSVIAQNKANGLKINYDTITEFGDIDTTNDKFSKAIRIPGEKFIFIPSYANYALLVDPIAKTTKKIGNMSSGQKNRAYGAVLCLDGTIFCMAFANEYSFVIDPVNETINEVGSSGSSAKWAACQILPDQRIVSIPYSSARFTQIDSINFDEISDFVTSNIASKYYGSKLLPSNKILATPYNVLQCALFDPDKNVLLPFGTTFDQQNATMGGVLLPDEKVFIFSYSASKCAICDTEELTVTPFGAADNRQYKYSGGCLLSDGRVLGTCGYVIPQTVAIIDLDDESITNVGSNNINGTKYVNANVLSTGEILLVNSSNSRPAILSASDGNYGVLPTEFSLLSAYINN